MIFIRDIERCPYVPSDSEYRYWKEKDDKRLRDLANARDHLLSVAPNYLSNQDVNIRNMAKFVMWILER